MTCGVAYTIVGIQIVHSEDACGPSAPPAQSLLSLHNLFMGRYLPSAVLLWPLVVDNVVVRRAISEVHGSDSYIPSQVTIRFNQTRIIVIGRYQYSRHFR